MSVARNTPKKQGICDIRRLSTVDPWPTPDWDLIELVAKLRKLARLAAKANRRGTLEEQTRVLAYVAHQIEIHGAALRREFDPDAFQEMADVELRRQMGSSVLGAK